MKGLKIIVGLGLVTCLFGCSKKKLKVDLKDKGTCIGRGYERYGWNSELNIWIPHYKIEKIYDEKEKLLYDLEYMNYNRKEWSLLSGLTEYIYNDKGQLIKITDSFDYGYDTLTLNNRIEEYEYDGDILVSKTQKNSKDVIDFKETYSYDSNGNLISAIHSGPYSYKREYTYNESNLKTKTLYYEYDNSMQAYKDPITEEEFEYNELNKLVTYYNKPTTGISEIYGNSSYKEITTYDSNNKIIEIIGYIIKDDTLTERFKVAYDYYDNGDKKSFTSKVFHNNEWVNYYKIVYYTTIYDD